MFYLDNFVWKSTFLERDGVGHAFSTRRGGVSTLAHTASMNVGFGRGDGDEVVQKNIEILCRAAGISYDGIVGSPQHHTTTVRYVTEKNAGEGIRVDNPSPSDGFVTDRRGVSLIIRTADCVPILLLGEKEDSSPVVGAAHAGWRGTVGLIAKELISKAVSLGAPLSSLRIAVGPCIGSCHFEVKEDFIEAVAAARGSEFAGRHIEKRGGSYFADLVSMNEEIILACGIPKENLDVSGVCTACDPETYHSHRATRGIRGTMGNVIGIV